MEKKGVVHLDVPTDDRGVRPDLQPPMLRQCPGWLRTGKDHTLHPRAKPLPILTIGALNHQSPPAPSVSRRRLTPSVPRSVGWAPGAACPQGACVPSPQRPGDLSCRATPLCMRGGGRRDQRLYPRAHNSSLTRPRAGSWHGWRLHSFWLSLPHRVADSSKRQVLARCAFPGLRPGRTFEKLPFVVYSGQGKLCQVAHSRGPGWLSCKGLLWLEQINRTHRRTLYLLPLKLRIQSPL